MSFGKNTHEGKASRRLSDNRKSFWLITWSQLSRKPTTGIHAPVVFALTKIHPAIPPSARNTIAHHWMFWQVWIRSLTPGRPVGMPGSSYTTAFTQPPKLRIPRCIKDWLDGKLPQGPIPVNTKDLLTSWHTYFSKPRRTRCHQTMQAKSHIELHPLFFGIKG